MRSPLSVGLYAGKWCSYNAPPDLPHDQRDEDGGALIFQTARLAQAVQEELARAQRRLSCKQKGSANRARAKLKVACIHARIADQRMDFAHKLTTKLIHGTKS